MLVQLWQWQGLVLLWLKDNSLLELGKCPFFFFCRVPSSCPRHPGKRQAQPLWVGGGTHRGHGGLCCGREMRKGLYWHTGGSRGQWGLLAWSPRWLRGPWGRHRDMASFQVAQGSLGAQSQGGDSEGPLASGVCGRETPYTHSQGGKGLRTPGSSLSSSLRPPRAALLVVLGGPGQGGPLRPGVPPADPPGHGAGPGANRRRVSPHRPRPRHSLPIHLPARQIPAPGHGNICLLLRVQLTCCRLLLRHRPFPPTATVTATAATVTAVTAPAAAMAAPQGLTAQPVALSQWKNHWDLTWHLPGCRKHQKAAAPAGQGPGVVSPVLCPPLLQGTGGSVGAPGVERGSWAVPGAAMGRGHSRGWHRRVPGRAAAAGTGTPHCEEPGTPRCPPVPLGAQCPRCGSCSPRCRRDLQAQAPVMSFAPDRWRQGARAAASAPPAPVPGP